MYTHSAVFRRNAGSEPVFGRSRAFRRNTVTSLRKGDACRPLAARRFRRTEKTTMVRRGSTVRSDPELPARHATRGTRSLLPRGRSPDRSAGWRRPLFTPQAIARHDERLGHLEPDCAAIAATCEREVVHLRQDHPSVVARHLRVRAWVAAQSPHPLVTTCSRRTALCPVRLLPEVVVGGVGDLGHGSCRCRVAVCGGGNVAAGGCDSLDVGGVPEPAGGR